MSDEADVRDAVNWLSVQSAWSRHINVDAPFLRRVGLPGDATVKGAGADPDALAFVRQDFDAGVACRNGGRQEVSVPPIPTVAGGFRVILVDPPWRFKSNSDARPGRSARRHYSTNSLEEIRALPVGSVAACDSALFLCITAPFLAIGAHLPILAAWGFKPSTVAFTWVKLRRGFDGDSICPPTDLHVGTGLTTRANAEFVILGKRGRSVRRDAGVHSTIIERVRQHSRKPVALHERIEHYASGPYLELFARESRANWVTWGLEATLFDPVPDCRGVEARPTADPRRPSPTPMRPWRRADEPVREPDRIRAGGRDDG